MRERTRGRWLYLTVVAVVIAASGAVAGRAWAYWNASATAPGTSLTAGRLDLTINGNLPGFGGTFANTAMSATGLIPTESVAFQVTLQNAGNVRFRVTATGLATGGLSVASGLQFSVHPGGTAANAGTAAAGTRSGTCSGAATFGPAPLNSSQAVIAAPGVLIAPAGAVPLCIRVALPASAPTALQGQSASATFSFSASQVNTP